MAKSKQVYFTAYSDEETYLCKGIIHHTNSKGISRVIVKEVGGLETQNMKPGRKLLEKKIPKNIKDIIDKPNDLFTRLFTQWIKKN